MPIYQKESLESLRHKVDLVEVLSSHVDLKRTGASYKALCPFHDEKSPSFVVQKGDTHYHCFGCGAHGDAIQFLMTHLRMSFGEAIESLAQKFHIHLEVVEGGEEVKGPQKGHLKEALENATQFFHFYLLHTPEGHEVLKYLYQRGIGLEFIRHFRLGLAPANQEVLRQIMHAKRMTDEVLEAAGLIQKTKTGRWRVFFSERITFPICDPSGSVIGFSARKYQEETYGGKYINTTETALFKKSRILFGLHLSRRRIAKEHRAIIVEGQIDALQLIYAGLDLTVASLGTAFGEEHAKELIKLGVRDVFLAMDGDKAGQEATFKIGNIFQKEGVEVHVVPLPAGSDPDSFVKDHGPEAFCQLLEKSISYLEFLVGYYSQTTDVNSPAGKNQVVQTLIKQVRDWNESIMVEESLRKLAFLMQLPEHAVGVGQHYSPNLYIKKSANIEFLSIDPDRIIEMDLLRWLLLMGDSQPSFNQIVQRNIPLHYFRNECCRLLYQTFLNCLDQGLPRDIMTLTIQSQKEEIQELLSEILQKKINKDKAEEQFKEAVQKLLDRQWMQQREEIKMRIQSGQCSDEEALALVKKFDELKGQPPLLILE